jgi:hypothetical protein
MKRLLFALILALVVLFSTPTFGQEYMYYCPDGNYYQYPCKPYYFEPGVCMGFYWLGGVRYFYPIIPGYPTFRFHPGYFHHWGSSLGGFHGHGRGFSSGHFGHGRGGHR